MCEHAFAHPVSPVQIPCYHKLYHSCQVLSQGVNSWNVLSPKTLPQIVTILSYIIPAPPPHTHTLAAFALKGASPSILGHEVLVPCGDRIKLAPHLTLVASSSTLDPTLQVLCCGFQSAWAPRYQQWPGGSRVKVEEAGGICEPHCVCFYIEDRHYVKFTRSKFSCSDSRHYSFQL